MAVLLRNATEPTSGSKRGVNVWLNAKEIEAFLGEGLHSFAQERALPLTRGGYPSFEISLVILAASTIAVVIATCAMLRSMCTPSWCCPRLP